MIERVNKEIFYIFFMCKYGKGAKLVVDLNILWWQIYEGVGHKCALSKFCEKN